MEITKNRENDILTVALKGRLDTNTAPQIEGAIKDELDKVNTINLDLKELEYISSAGLRVILMLHKYMTKKNGVLYVYHAIDEVLEVFDMTGFSSFLNIKETN